MIELIAFDLIGVLITQKHIIRDNLMKIEKHAHYSKIKENYKLLKVGKTTEEQFWKTSRSKFEKLEKLFLDSLHIDPEYYEYIKPLKEKYKLAIISDIPELWGKYLTKKYRFDETFNIILMSGAIGDTKEHKKIFKILIKKSGIEPMRIIFIDDEKENLKHASDVKIKTVWFNIEKDNFKYKPDYTIKSLKEINKII